MGLHRDATEVTDESHQSIHLIRDKNLVNDNPIGVRGFNACAAAYFPRLPLGPPGAGISISMMRANEEIHPQNDRKHYEYTRHE